MVPEPKADQIKADLIGKNISLSGVVVWEFAALSEFESFEITGKQKQGNAIEYDVSMRLVDLASQAHFSANLAIVYKRSGISWQLVSVVAKEFKPVSSGKTVMRF